MTKKKKALQISKQTIRMLNDHQMTAVAGGGSQYPYCTAPRTFGVSCNSGVVCTQ